MKFWEAMRELENGKKVCLRGSEPNTYLEKRERIFYFGNWNPLGSHFYSEWELYEEPERMLSFSEMVAGLKQGKRFIRPNMNHPFCLGMLGNKIVYCDIGVVHGLSLEDIEAADWVEVRE